MLVLAVCAHAVLDEAQDLGGRHKQDVHDYYGDKDGRDAVVGVDVRGRHAVATTELRRFTESLHEPHVAEGENGERKADAEREVQPVVDVVRALPHHHVVVAEVHVMAVSARHRLDVEFEQARDVEDDAYGRHERYRCLHPHHADHVTRLERVADGQVTSHRHDNRQPRARLDERVDEGAAERAVDKLEADAPVREPDDTRQLTRFNKI